MVGRLHLHVCMLLWATSGCAGLYFYAHDYYSWAANVMFFRDTAISRRNGWLQLNRYTNFTLGRALYKTSFQIQNSLNNSVASFNTSFVFSMNTDRSKDFFGDGLAFLICPGRFRNDSFQVSSGGYLGMFNSSTNGLADNRVFAVEFDTHLNPPFHDPNDNHIGIDINSVHSLRTNDLSSLGIVLNEGRKIICWIDYDGGNRYLWVYLAYSPSKKPSLPIIAMDLDLAPYMRNNAYVGFTSSTGARAELHTIYSWWFLSGFGNLNFPTSPSSRPLTSLGRRSVVITVFTLAAAFGFLCLFYYLARCRWQKESQHLIDIFLPVACWMYWKESINQEVRLKLAKPTVELLAWLWRTRWARRQNQPRVKNWREMFLKRKMGPLLEKEAWQLENKRQMHYEPPSALQGPACEEPVDNSSGADTQARVEVAKNVKQKPVPGKKVKAAEKKKKGSPRKAKCMDSTPLLVAEIDRDLKSIQGKDFEPRLRNFRISNVSFIMMDKESPSHLKQETVTEDNGGGPSHMRRGSCDVHNGDTTKTSDVKALEGGDKDQASIPVEDAGSSSSLVLTGKSDITTPEAISDKVVEPSPHPSGSELHVTQRWLFD